jgi:tetratricopeptide (TPR) repeat protein
MKHISAPLPPLRQIVAGLPDSVERLILKALAKDPAERYQSAAEFRDAVERVRISLPSEISTSSGRVTATPAKPSEPTVMEPTQLAKGGGRNTTGLAIGAVAVIAVIIGAVVIFSRPPAPTPTGTPGATVTTPVAAAASATQPPPTVPTAAGAATQNAPTVATAAGGATATTQPAPASAVASLPNAKYAALIEQVKTLIVSGSPGDAHDLIDKALESDPQSYDLLVLRGRVLMEQGRERRDQAKADVDAALKIDPNRPEAYITLGLYYLFPNTDNSDEIIASLKNSVANYTQAIARGSQDYYAYWGRATANNALNGYVGSQNNVPIDNILKDLDQAAKYSPKDPRFWMARGELYFDATEYAEALKSINEAVALRPTYTDYHPAAATCYLMLGQPEKALELYTKNIDLQGVAFPKYLADGAYLARASKKIDIARKWAQQALTIDPNTPAATYLLALIDADDRKFDDALKKLDEVAKITENKWVYEAPFLNRRFDHHVLLDRGRILAQAGRVDDAIAAYGVLIEQEIYWSLPLIERARLLQQQGKIEEARSDLRKALELANGNGETGRRNEILEMLGRLATQAAGTPGPAGSATPG